jgi:hypothetical protein
LLGNLTRQSVAGLRFCHIRLSTIGFRDSVSLPVCGSIYPGSRRVPDVRIVVDANSAAGPWEAILGVVNTETTQFAEIPARFNCSVRFRSPSTQPDWERPMKFTTWTYRGLGTLNNSVPSNG